MDSYDLDFFYDFCPERKMGNMNFKRTYKLAHGLMKSMDLDYKEL